MNEPSTFADFLRTKILLPRLEARRVLVVFDGPGRYREVCADLASERCKFIDTTKRPVSARLEAMERWVEMSGDSTFQSQLLVYCPEDPPTDEEDKRLHPFTGYAAIGDDFPTKPGDAYRELCCKFLKDRTREIDQLFAGDSEPGFELIDNLAGGTRSHPRLQAIFGTGDVSKIIPDFLVPPAEVAKKLEADDNWAGEFRDLIERTLGLSVDRRATNPATLREKLWQYLLFSEFIGDLPQDAPPLLEDVPRAQGSFLTFVRSLCEDLRKHRDKRDTYREAALRIEEQLDLVEECRDLLDLGEVDTFAFEERKQLQRAMTGVRAGDLNLAGEINRRHRHGIWTEEGERMLLWRILDLGLEVIGESARAREVIDALGTKAGAWIETYVTNLSHVDRTCRALEEAASQTITGYEEVEAVIDRARDAYLAFFNSLQERLLNAVQREGWPLPGAVENRDTYDDLVAPALREGKRVVYFLVDALRFGLAQDIMARLLEGTPTLTAACAQLPCVTRFGMASLLPEASKHLKFEARDGELIPVYDGKPVATRAERLQVFHSHLNQRVAVSNLSDFLSQVKTKKGRESFLSTTANADLLVLTSTELDDEGEGRASAPMKHLASVVQELIVAVSKTASLGYDLAVIATDHGFVYHGDMSSGNQCTKPPGQWLLQKRRCLIGEGDEGPGVVRFPTRSVGIPAEAPSFVVPRGLATFRKGSGYFHEGLSFQESVVPRLVVAFSKEKTPSGAARLPELVLSRTKRSFSSRIVAISVSWPGTKEMFSAGAEVQLAALQNKTEVGEVTSHEKIDPSSGLLRLQAGESLKVNMRISDQATEGPVQIKAIDPVSGKTLGSYELNFQPNTF